METFDALSRHRSIRKYKPDAIPQEHVDKILHAAVRASSSGNMQTYSIIVTRDEKRKAKLWEMHYKQDMILQAPMLLTFVVDWNRMNHWCRVSDAEPGFDNFLSYLVGFADAIIAAQNAALAAEDMGYGICYMGTTLGAAPRIAEFLDLPPSTFPATTLVVGVPDEDPDLRARLPIESIVHDETYQHFDDKRVAATYQARETEGWNRYMSYPDMAKVITESDVRNLAEIYTKLKYTKSDNEEVSEELRQLMVEPGFFPADG